MSFDVVQFGSVLRLIEAALGRTPKWGGSLNNKGHLYDFAWIREGMDFWWQNTELKSRKVALPAFICPIVPRVLEKNGLEPVFGDVSLDDFHLNKVPSNAGAVIVNHTLGMPFDVKKIGEFKGLIVEDVAHGWGAKLNGKWIGTDGDAAFFSFYKQVANGHGGLLWSRNEMDTSELRQAKFPWLKSLVFSRGVGAALNLWRRQTGLAGGEIPELNEPRRCSKMGNKLFARSFSTLEEEVEGRQKVTKWYLEKMDEKFVIPQQGPKGAEPSYFRFNLRLKPELASKRDEVLLKLRRKGVFADRLWSNAPAKGFPNAELLAKSVINLPIKSTYSKKDVDKLFNIFYECF